jgi:hypothetical protein
MDFQQLLAKMQELDRPATESIVDTPVTECPPAMGPMGGMDMGKPDTPPPSMSLNLNAQGLDNIEELMKLIKAVNPGMDKPEGPIGGMMPSIEIEPMDKPAGLPPLGGLGNLDSGPLKMLPDFDADNDNEPGGELDGADVMSKAQGDLDNDGDHDMDDHDMEKDDGEETDDSKEKESFANEPDTEIKSVDYMNNQLAGGMNRPKGQHKHSYQAGDNPMAMEGEDLRAWIKNELTQRLAEAKLSELSKDTLKSYKDKSDVAVGKAAAAEKDDGKFAKRFSGGMKAQAKLDKKGDE